MDLRGVTEYIDFIVAVTIILARYPLVQVCKKKKQPVIA